jgi:8-oxo-dGTP diphosphatase
LKATKRLGNLLWNYSCIALQGSAGSKIQHEPLVLAQGVIQSEQGVLLSVRSDLWGWELPGGTAERGESPEQTLLREVREETGLEVAVDSKVGRYLRSGFHAHTAHVYRCRVVGGSLRKSRESLCLRWFPRDALPDTIFPWYRGPLEDALDAGLMASGDEVERSEHQGKEQIMAGMRIDLKMRFGADGSDLE